MIAAFKIRFSYNYNKNMTYLALKLIKIWFVLS